jgi:hypothetical protein
VDKYDKAIAILKEDPKQISRAWGLPYEHDAGCLFQFLTKDFVPNTTFNQGYGCPTMIKGGYMGREFRAQLSELTTLVMKDDRIPESYGDISVDCLDAFAEIQRKADKLLERA